MSRSFWADDVGPLALSLVVDQRHGVPRDKLSENHIKCDRFGCRTELAYPAGLSPYKVRAQHYELGWRTTGQVKLLDHCPKHLVSGPLADDFPTFAKGCGRVGWAQQSGRSEVPPLRSLLGGVRQSFHRGLARLCIFSAIALRWRPLTWWALS